MRLVAMAVALLAVPAPARADLVPITCPAGTTYARTATNDAFEEACRLPDGRRHGSWRRYDRALGWWERGGFFEGTKHGTWRAGTEECTFDRGREVATYDPWHWSHRRFAVMAGGGVGAGGGLGSLTVQLGWDVWVEARHCVLRHRAKDTPRSLAVIGDVHLLSGDAPHRARLGLQAYRSNLEPDGPFSLGGTSFASLGAIVTAERAIGIAASIGFNSILYRLELRGDFVPRDAVAVTLAIGIDDYFLRR